MYVMEIPKEGRKGTEEVLEVIMSEAFLRLMSDTKPQIQKTKGTQSRKNIKPNYI